MLSKIFVLVLLDGLDDDNLLDGEDDCTNDDDGTRDGGISGAFDDDTTGIADDGADDCGEDVSSPEADNGNDAADVEGVSPINDEGDTDPITDPVCDDDGSTDDGEGIGFAWHSDSVPVSSLSLWDLWVSCWASSGQMHLRGASAYNCSSIRSSPSGSSLSLSFTS